MASKSAELILRLVDQVTAPAGKIRAELAGLTAMSKTMGKSGAISSTMVPTGAQRRDLDKTLGALAAQRQGIAGVATSFAAQDRAARRAAGSMAVYARQAKGAEQALGGLSGGMMRAEAAAVARTAALFAPAAAAYGGARAYGDFAAAEREMTRTGLKLGANRETMAEIRQEMDLIANKYAVPIAEVMASFDSLAESGFELAEARSSLDGVVKATQGLGGSGKDTVNTFDAARKSIKLAAAESEKFFDIIAAGGSMGKFEGSDLARYLPSLLPVVARQGYKGLDGAARLVGFLEVMRDFVGSSEEAATATQDIFEKISSPDVLKKFGEFGVDLEKELKTARDNGQDVLAVLSDIIKEVTKGDATKLSQLFGDRDSRRAANVLLTQFGRVEDAQRKLLANSGGTIRHNVEIVTEDAQAKIDRMANSWDRFKKSVGAGIAVGATPALDAVTEAMDRGQAYKIGIEKQEAQGGSKAETRAEFDRRYEDVNPDFDWYNPIDQQERSKAFVKAMQAYGRGDTDSPYADLDRVLDSRKGGRFPGLEESFKRADAWAKQQAAERTGNIDGMGVRHGIPTPKARPDGTTADAVMTLAKQLAEYGRGRLLGEEGARDRRENMPARIIERSEPGSSGWRGGGFDDGAAAAVVPDPAEMARVGAAILDWGAKAREVGATITAALGLSTTPKVDTGQIDAAGTRATTVGTTISQALGLTVTPIVNTSSIDAAASKAAGLASALRAIAGAPGVTSGAGRPVSGGSVIGSMAPPATTAPGRRASGGPIAALAPTIVGERGPELITPGRNSYVTPTHRLVDGREARAAPSGATVTNHFHNQFKIDATNPTAAANEIAGILERQLNRSRQISLEDRSVI